MPQIRSFLQQDLYEKSPFEDLERQMAAILRV
jgi:hypothetical protein